jgi:type II secretory pathway component PulJ
VSRRHAAFTLVEMLAVVFLMGLVVSTIVNFYLELSRQSNAAANATRLGRRGSAALDRIARELEASLLVVRPGEVDPLDHPWVFFAENRDGGEGADRLRFVTWSHRPRAGALRESDMAVVAYGLRESAAGTRDLMRWSVPRLPDQLEREVPVEPDEGAQVLLEDVAEFGLRFLGESGEWTDAWDSSSLVESNLLPVAAEIHLALEEPDPEVAPNRIEKQVVLALRPLDLQVLLAPDDPNAPGDESEEEEDDEQTTGECVTVDECRALHPEQDLSAVDPTVLESVGSQCASEVTAFFAVPEDCL